MTEPITPRQFHQADGVEDWRVVAGGACAYFRTGSFATGVTLVGAIGELADAATATRTSMCSTRGGPWPTPRATRSTWPPGWAETSTTGTELCVPGATG